MTKIDNRFVISLDSGYVLRHCNAKKRLLWVEFRKSTLISVWKELYYKRYYSYSRLKIIICLQDYYITFFYSD